MPAKRKKSKKVVRKKAKRKPFVDRTVIIACTRMPEGIEGTYLGQKRILGLDAYILLLDNGDTLYIDANTVLDILVKPESACQKQRKNHLKSV